MPYAWIEHTAEIELVIESDSEVGLFVEALRAFSELTADEAGGDELEFDVAATAHDRGALLAEWIGELVFLAETEDFIPEDVHELSLEGDAVRATIVGRRGRPSHLVKAVTYHGLEFGRTGERWHARAVLDV